ncbi:histidine phosphatase family protein [Pseudomonas sp. CCI4.2]|uniref:histidine phosphatase family protein n=1 Tax=Pseudomonas sp. CCI4.2 TaxID=3048620 RepID=UPI002AC9AA85|nr:histidine phosphatase family protein [Pseudomonas sp. CCI4.2]MEB0092412.1 histidine phosphatase family protein [Pseudomonas sp. CCI4.2]WPX52066.1 histidine phosphatase family protein [Pseudomonas sp. CCI4.2]
MATRLTLICHARTVAQKLGRFAQDEPIEMDWQSSAGSLSGHFKLSAQLLSAPETRAQQTGLLFASELDIVPALRDCDFGRWQGQRIDDLQAQEPEALNAWLTDSMSAPHGGESIADVCARVSAWLDTLRTPGHIIAITHPFIIRAAIVHALQCPMTAFNAIDIEPLSMTELRYNGRWRLRMERAANTKPL